MGSHHQMGFHSEGWSEVGVGQTVLADIQIAYSVPPNWLGMLSAQSEHKGVYVPIGTAHQKDDASRSFK